MSEISAIRRHSVTPTSPPRVVILGARGVIGNVTSLRLDASGIPVLALGSDHLDLLASDAAERLAERLRPSDSVVMLAALTPDRGRDVATMIRNVQMGATLCDALDRCPVTQVIYVSSDGVYPFVDAPVTETSCASPSDLYRAMHLIRERLLAHMNTEIHCILRVTQVCAALDTHNAYGPNRFLAEAATKGTITLFGKGEENRDHIMVDDVAEIIRLCLLHRVEGLVNVATGRSLCFGAVADLVASQFSSPPRIVHVPRVMPVTHRWFDISRLLAVFPELRFTPLEEGIAAVYAVNQDQK